MGDGGERPAVLVADRQVSEESVESGAAGGGQGARPRRADAGEVRDGGVEVQGIYGTSNLSATTPQRTSSLGLSSAGTPVSRRAPFRNVAFIVPISSERKNLGPRR